MKVCLVFENYEAISKSGIGKAYKHQCKAHEIAGIETTTDWKNDSYDILHINTYGLKSKKIIRTARKKGAKVIYHAHSTKEDFQNSFVGSNVLAGTFKRWISARYKKADIIITPTPYSKELLETYKLKTPIYDVSNGVDTEEFKSGHEKEFRDHFKLSAEDKVIVSAGLWIKRKGIFDFIEVAKKMPEYKFIWFGKTPKAIMKRNVKKLVFKNKVENVIFPGYLSGNVFKGAFSGCDAFFFPSNEETEGIVILEALASSQKIVVRDIGAYKGWMKNNENCLMGTNNEEFEKLIREITSKPFNDLKKNARKTATEVKDIKVVSKKLVEIYNLALKK